LDSLRRRVTSSRSLDASAHIDPLRRDEATGGHAGPALVVAVQAEPAPPFPALHRLAGPFVCPNVDSGSSADLFAVASHAKERRALSAGGHAELPGASRCRRSAGWAGSLLPSGSPPATCRADPQSRRPRAAPRGTPGARGRSSRRAADSRRPSRRGGSARRSPLGVEPSLSGFAFARESFDVSARP
jgi:hypothetical protein